MHTTFKLALGTAAILAAFGASAQTFPAAGKSITIVVPFSAGGPTDRVARDLAEALRKPLGGATVVIDNVYALIAEADKVLLSELEDRSRQDLREQAPHGLWHHAAVRV